MVYTGSNSCKKNRKAYRTVHESNLFAVDAGISVKFLYHKTYCSGLRLLELGLKLLLRRNDLNEGTVEHVFIFRPTHAC